jgi:hypothetical protein
MARFDGAYLRFTGERPVEHCSSGRKVEPVSDAGIWELMYFGHARWRQLADALRQAGLVCAVELSRRG